MKHTEQNADHSSSISLEGIEKKRQLVMSLLRVARDIVGHTHTMQDVLLLARPSQKYPEKVKAYKQQVDKAILFMHEPELLNRSAKFDNQTSLLLDALLEFIEITQLQVTEDRNPKEFSEEVKQQFNEFGVVTRTAIALRILLQEEGVILPPVKFGFPQEWIGEQISNLNDTNHQLRLKITDQVAELIFDTNHLLAKENLSSAMREKLEYVQHAMQEDLEYLEHGGNIEQLPYEFETLDVDALPANALHEYLEEKQVNTKIVARNEEAHKKKMGFNEKLKLWLNTPWETRWRDLD